MKDKIERLISGGRNKGRGKGGERMIKKKETDQEMVGKDVVLVKDKK